MGRKAAERWTDGGMERENRGLTYPGGLPSGLTMAAKEEVITTRVTVGALALMALRMPRVPFMAGSRRSFWVSVRRLTKLLRDHLFRHHRSPVTLKWNGEAV